MAEREELELQRGPAPQGSEKRRPKSGQQVPKWESKGEQQLPVYQSNPSLRELQCEVAVSGKVTRQLFGRGTPNLSQCQTSFRPRHLIAFTGRLPAAPPHDLIESGEIRPCFPVREKSRRLECRHFFRHCRSDKLIDAGLVFPAEPLHCLFEGTWEP